jgi:hypothetical protein
MMMIGGTVPIVVIDMSLSAPVMIIIGSTMRAWVSAKLAHSAGHPPMMIPQARLRAGKPRCREIASCPRPNHLVCCSCRDHGPRLGA